MNFMLLDLTPDEWSSIPRNVLIGLAVLLGENYEDVVECKGVIPENHFTVVNGKYTLPAWKDFGEFDTIDDARYEAESYATGILDKHYESQIDREYYRRYGRHED